MPLPPVPIPGAASAAATGKGGKEIDRRLADPGATSLSLVRYRTNDYSVPVAYGYRDVLVRGYVDEVVISCGPEVIAKHPRSYERDDFVYDPIHYLPLLERKPGALDQAAPLQGWELPDEFGTLRRLLETFSQQEVHAAIRDARCGDHQGVPLDHQVQQFQEAAAVVLGPAGLLSSNVAYGTAGANSRSTCRSRFWSSGSPAETLAQPYSVIPLHPRLE